MIFGKIILATATMALFASTNAQAQSIDTPSATSIETSPIEIISMSIRELEDSLAKAEAVTNYVERDLPAYVADELYGEWNSIFLTPTSIPNDRLPEKFNIDLSGFVFPHQGRITSGFGVRSKYRNHYGIDLSARVGDQVKAAFSGKVRIAGYDRNGFGYYVVIRHHNGLETIYGHLNRNIVKKGQEVVAGETIGRTGISGRMTGCVLHFEIRFLGTPFDPQRFFDFGEKKQLANNFTYTKDMHDVKSRIRKGKL